MKTPSLNRTHLLALALATAAFAPACHGFVVVDDEHHHETRDAAYSEDWDMDGLYADEERSFGTSDRNADTDGDGIDDGDEVFVYLTDPVMIDTDFDGLYDGEEVFEFFTDPLDHDSDHDDLLDGEEVFEFYTDPNFWDTDEDGYSDGFEVSVGSDPLRYNYDIY